MYIKLDTFLLEKIEEKTGHIYERAGNYLDTEEIPFILDNLLDQLEKVETAFIEYTKEVDENYIEKKVDPYEFYGVSERDFVWI